MKLIDVVNAYNSINGLSENNNIGAHLAYIMTKFVITTQPDFEFYIKELRKLFEKYGKKDDETDEIVILSENTDEFKKSVQDLQNVEVDDPKIYFSLSELSNELKLSMKQIYPLINFIKEDESNQ